MSNDVRSSNTIDATGIVCPEPLMLLHAAMRKLSAGEEVELIATDPSTSRDVTSFCEFLGHSLLVSEQVGNKFRYRIRKADA